jgi:hypothetical protein
VEEDEIDQEKQAAILETYTRSGIMTLNEAREKLGPAPVDYTNTEAKKENHNDGNDA